jgi:hypothetical protein
MKSVCVVAVYTIYMLMNSCYFILIHPAEYKALNINTEELCWLQYFVLLNRISVSYSR